MRLFAVVAVVLANPWFATGDELELPATPLTGAKAALVRAEVEAGQRRVSCAVPSGFEPSHCRRCGTTSGRVSAFQATSARTVTVELDGNAASRGIVTAFFWKPDLDERRETPEYFVAPNGKSDNEGSRDHPWDLRSALDGRQTVPPGALIWFESGTYSDPQGTHGLERAYRVALSGEKGRPIHIAPIPGAIVKIEGGIFVRSKGWLWIGGFELHNGDPVPGGEPTPGGTVPKPLPVGFDEWGGAGIGVLSGTDVVIYNNITSGGSHAYSAWNAAPRTVFLGNIAFDAGWIGADRAHGHCIYAQNAPKTGAKWLRHNLFEIRSRASKGNYGLHLYVKSTALAEFSVWQNAIKGPVTVQSGQYCEKIDFRRNCVASVITGDSAIKDGSGNSFGKPGCPDRDIVLRENTFVNGVKRLENNKWENVKSHANRVVKTDSSWWVSDIGTPPAHVVRESGDFVDYSKGGKDEYRVWANEIDFSRTHVAIMDFDQDGIVHVDLGSILTRGDRFRVHHFKQVSGKPQMSGVFTGELVPMKVAVPGDALDMFVVFRSR